MAAKRPPSSYYYASGKKIRLLPDGDLVAVNERHFDSGEGDAAPVEGRTPLRAGYALWEKDKLPSDTLERLEKECALQPVFRHSDTIMIPLPEIRIEDGDPGKLDEILNFLRDQAGVVSDRDGDRLSLRLDSRRGADALTLANAIVEKFHPDAVSPNFLRITPGPGG